MKTHSSKTKFILWGSLLGGFALCLNPLSPAGRAADDVPGATPLALPLALPGPIPLSLPDTPRLAQLKRQLAKFPTYAGYREMADIYLDQARYDDAARAYRQEADLFRRNGYKDAAIAVETKAARYDSELRIFQERPLTPGEAAELDTHALWEPHLGVYAGAYIDLDDQLPNAWTDEQGRQHHNPAVFENVVDKSHGTYFMYIGYGQPFPRRWLEQCKKAGVIAHLAFEPSDLNAVQDDDYLRYFARECGRLDWPIFLRYASEMNGDWTAWHGNPALYREKFRLIHRVFKQYAPKVATIWCVNSVPTETIPDYYPGDDACDWVGINVYSVPFYGNDPKRSGLQDSALPFIAPIYKMYGARKPIAICEFGASYMAAVDNVPRPDFAASRMKYLYEALPRFFPRIKMVSWFDVNTIRHGSPGSPNNYALTENPEVLATYRELVKDPYFLGASSWKNATTPSNLVTAPSPVQTVSNHLAQPTALSQPMGLASPAPVLPRLVRFGEPLSGQIKLSFWVKTVVEQPHVFIGLNNQVIYAGLGNGVHNVALDSAQLPAGSKRVRIYVYDEQNRFVSTAATTFTVGRGRDLGTRPLQISGTVQRFYLDGTGSVAAFDVATPGTIERVYFDPSTARQMMAEHPLYSHFNAWVVPRQTSLLDQQMMGQDPTSQDLDALPTSWNLASMGEEMPAFPVQLNWQSGLQSLEADMARPADAPAAFVTGNLTKVVQNSRGEVLALVLDNKSWVRILASLRAPIMPNTPALNSIPVQATPTVLQIGASIGVAGWSEPVTDGQISIYASRVVAQRITVNRRKAPSLSFPKIGRQTRALTRDGRGAEMQDEGIGAAQGAGLSLYQPPLIGGRALVRGSNTAEILQSVGNEPMLNAKKRPW